MLSNFHHPKEIRNDSPIIQNPKQVAKREGDPPKRV
jgi:hypothetical protein